jgi:CubicO group peptidase (beta-lactamase class C family)
MIKYFLTVLFFLLSLKGIHAQLHDSLVKKVDAVFAEYDRTNSPGCALAILKDGKIIYKRGYGMSNLEYGMAISASSIFHVASISKQFTAAAIIRLSLEGRVSLNDDIRKHLPEVPDFGHKITYNHLIWHTSGLRDQWDLQRLAGWRSGDVITENDIIEMLKRQKALNFTPGEDYSYCNTGYTLLGIAVKRITGVSLRDYADSVFFKPLGMDNTHFHSDHSEITYNRTSAYVKDNKGKWKISIPVFDNYGATSLFTTVEDLARWDENFYTKKIGGEDFIRAMQLTGTLNNSTPQNYASGLILRTYKGNSTVEHSGADAGYRSNFLRFPEQHFSIVLLANLANINTVAVSYKIADIFIKDKTQAEPPSFVQTDSAIIKGWAGRYMDPDSKALVFLNYGNGRLLRGTDTLKARNNELFSDVTSTYSLSGDTANALLMIKSPGTTDKKLKKIKMFVPTAIQLKEYQGSFYSPELDTRFTVYLKEDSLFLKSSKLDEVRLMPITQDMFSAGSLIFDFSNRRKKIINDFDLYTGRSRKISFSRLKTDR